MTALAAASLPVVVVNPRQVRDCAKSTGQLAKTDRLNARALAHFSDAVRPEVRSLRDTESQALNSLAARRHQLMDMVVSEKNRLNSAAVTVRPVIEHLILWLEGALDDVLRSVPGVGEQLSLTLLAYLPELGTLNLR